MAKSDDFMLRILLAIIVLVVFMRTLSVKRAREFKRTYNEVMQILSENVSQNSKKASNKNESNEEKLQEAQQSSKKEASSKKSSNENMSDEERSQSSKKVLHNSYKKSQSSKEVAFLTLDDELKAKIVKNLKYKHYALTRRLLERAGYTNVIIKKVRNMILIETDQGRTVLMID
jgi:F0F1-type ATP synthase membrane subunit b/b'